MIEEFARGYRLGDRLLRPAMVKVAKGVSKRDYYEILGVARDATDQQIKSAYRKLALKHHPDRNPGDKEAEEKFKEAAEAYAIVWRSATSARVYDRFGHAGVAAPAAGGFDPTMFAGFEDIFGGLGDIFGFGDIFGGRRRRGGPQRGADLRYDLEISFEESSRRRNDDPDSARRDVRHMQRLRRRARHARRRRARSARAPGQLRYQQGFLTVARPCRRAAAPARSISKPCQRAAAPAASGASGRSRSRFPPASPTASGCASTAKGEHGAAGGPPGDLYVVIHVQEHPFFHREGDDLYCEMPVSFPMLALGGEIARADDEGRRGDQGSGRHAGGRALQAARQGHAERLRPRRTAIST